MVPTTKCNLLHYHMEILHYFRTPIAQRYRYRGTVDVLLLQVLPLFVPLQLLRRAIAAEAPLPMVKHYSPAQRNARYNNRVSRITPFNPVTHDLRLGSGDFNCHLQQTINGSTHDAKEHVLTPII